MLQLFTLNIHEEDLLPIVHQLKNDYPWLHTVVMSEFGNQDFTKDLSAAEPAISASYIGMSDGHIQILSEDALKTPVDQIARKLSKRLGKRMWEELKIPSFLYEDSATVPERRNLATCRKGQFEGMPEKLLQPEWAPDFGERKIHPTAGITAIGARPPLVAFNVNLATSDVQIAKKIAKVIRASSGGFKACKAMGFMLEDRGIAQVSMNMVNYEVTSLPVVYEMIRALAERYGTHIVGSELVGLAPAKALLDCAEFYLKLENFDYKNQVMEYHLIDMLGE